MEWISLTPDGQGVPSHVDELRRLLQRHLPALRATETAAGGLRRVDLTAVIRAPLRQLQDDASPKPTFAAVSWTSSSA